MSVTIADDVVITVKIGFSTSAGNNTIPINSTITAIVYTDVSSYVRDISIKRGRSSELDDFTTGNCRVTFDNRQRVFDPENTAGPYYGKLTPGRPILIEATAPGGIAEGIFQGYIDQWDQQYENPKDAVAAVTASDAFKVLNLLTLRSAWDYYIDLINPIAWFRFDDGDAPSTAFESVSSKALGVWKNSSGVASTGASTTSIVKYNDSSAASFNASGFIEVPLATMPFQYGDSTTKTLTFWISTTTTTNGSYGIFYKPGNEATIAVGMVVTGGVGVIQAQWGSISGINTATAFTSAITVNDGKPHNIRLNWNSPTGELYVDDVKATTTASFTTSTPTETNIVIGKPYTSSATATYNMTSYFTGTIDEMVFLNSFEELFYSDFINGLADGFPAYYQMEQVLLMAGWMFDADSLSVDATNCQGLDIENKSVLSFLKQCEQANQGRLFTSREGVVTYLSRNEFATNSICNTSQRTFGDSTGELPYLDLEFTYNDQLIFNRSIVSRKEGATAVIEDSSSQGQYFIRTDNLSGLINDSDADMADIARMRIATYKQPQLRIDKMTFTPRRTPSMYSHAISDDIGTRITVKRRPQKVGSVISKELIIEGIEHEISNSSWVTTYNLSPAPVPFLILDNSVYGKLDSTNVLGY